MTTEAAPFCTAAVAAAKAAPPVPTMTTSVSLSHFCSWARLADATPNPAATPPTPATLMNSRRETRDCFERDSDMLNPHSSNLYFKVCNRLDLRDYCTL